MIVMELVSQGSLLNYLRTSSRQAGHQGLVEECQPGCCRRDGVLGVKELHTQDLAARNCLVRDSCGQDIRF